MQYGAGSANKFAITTSRRRRAVNAPLRPAAVAQRCLVRLVPALILALAPRVVAADPAPVRIETGLIRGAITADGRVVAFKGIPYAAPPVGDRRWKPPMPAPKWSGVRRTASFGPRCIQSAHFPDMVFRDPGESEDCLTLNVWAPTGTRRGGLPVMVWIYGGGFVAGGTSEGRQDGEVLAHRNVVVVSMNYRLGIIGFFSHPALAMESPHHASGNYGLLDQTAAIGWVRRNIRAFGGDPSNITLFGESAGSYSVGALMVSPLSKKLLSKAIGESGGALQIGSDGLPEASERAGAQFAEQVFHTNSLAALRRLPAMDLVKAATAPTTPTPPRFGPRVDGYFLRNDVASLYAAGRQAHIPVLGGWNADECGCRIARTQEKMTVERFRRQAQAEFAANAAPFLALYPASSDREAARSAADFAGDRFIGYSTWRWLNAQTKTGHAPVYRYRLDLAPPGDLFHPATLGATPGAFHSDDIEYVFGTLDSRAGAHWRPQDRKLSDQMTAYWTNFARTGNPNKPATPGLPHWPRYAAADGWQVMHLDAESQARPDEARARYRFLDRAWAH